MTDKIKLSDLPRALAQLGVSATYLMLWHRAMNGAIPAERANGRWFVSASDLPAIAATLSGR